MGKRKRKETVAIDHGPAELRWHKPIVLEETTVAGVLRARDAHECLLDVMLEKGALQQDGEEDRVAANRRYDAGMWLRRFHQQVQGQRVTVDYFSTGYGTGEMSDEEAVRHSALMRTVRVLGQHWDVLRRVCSDDQPDQTGRICEALDRLADWRGI